MATLSKSLALKILWNPIKNRFSLPFFKIRLFQMFLINTRQRSTAKTLSFKLKGLGCEQRPILLIFLNWWSWLWNSWWRGISPHLLLLQLLLQVLVVFVYIFNHESKECFEFVPTALFSICVPCIYYFFDNLSFLLSHFLS